MGNGAGGLELRAQLITLATLVVLLAAAARLPIAMIALAVLVTYALRAALLCRALYLVIGASLRTLAATMVPGAVATATAFVAGWALQIACGDGVAFLRDGVALAGFLAAYALAMGAFGAWSRDGAFRQNFHWLVELASRKLPLRKNPRHG